MEANSSQFSFCLFFKNWIIVFYSKLPQLFLCPYRYIPQSFSLLLFSPFSNSSHHISHSGHLASFISCFSFFHFFFNLLLAFISLSFKSFFLPLFIIIKTINGPRLSWYPWTSPSFWSMLSILFCQIKLPNISFPFPKIEDFKYWHNEAHTHTQGLKLIII